MNNYRKSVWILNCIGVIICLPILIPLMIFVSPFCFYDWLKKKAERIEDHEDYMRSIEANK